MNRQPRMFAPLPYGVNWRGKVAVRERAHWNGKEVVMRTGMIPERGRARRAEMKAGGIAAVADMHIDVVFTTNRHRVRRKPRLHRADRPAAPLAIIAMAHRHADGFSLAGRGKPAAAAGGGAGHLVALSKAGFKAHIAQIRHTIQTPSDGAGLGLQYAVSRR
jgi:hypothetical protein